MNIYLAARYSRRQALRQVASRLIDAGHRITSRWIESDPIAGDPPPDARTVRRAGRAVEDWIDLLAADCVIAFTEEERSPLAGRGGRHVELGLALAWNKRILVVGPRENVFCCLPWVEVFDHFDAALAALNGEAP